MHSIRAVALGTVLLALAVFSIVQDRVTAAGARRYVALQREAMAGLRSPVTIDDVMGPAVRQSVRAAGLSAGVVVAAGVALGLARRRR